MSAGSGILADQELAAWLAEATGRALLGVRLEAEHEHVDTLALGQIADRRAHDFLSGWLRALRPSDAVLSEEAADDPHRTSARRLWIVDPLDGTREFCEAGRTDWAVHVALVVDAQVAAGAVAVPAQSLVLSSADHFVPPDRLPARPRILVSRTRPPIEANEIAASVGGILVAMGSSGAKTAAVVTGRAEIYVHSGGQWEWDLAAPVGIARAAGLHVSRLDGSPVRFNQSCPWLPDVLICRHRYADAVLEAIALGRSLPRPGRAERSLRNAARGTRSGRATRPAGPI